MFSDLSDYRLVLTAFGTALACIVIGLYIVRKSEEVENKKKNKKDKKNRR